MVRHQFWVLENVRSIRITPTNKYSKLTARIATKLATCIYLCVMALVSMVDCDSTLTRFDLEVTHLCYNLLY